MTIPTEALANNKRGTPNTHGASPVITRYFVTKQCVSEEAFWAKRYQAIHLREGAQVEEAM